MMNHDLSLLIRSAEIENTSLNILLGDLQSALLIVCVTLAQLLLKQEFTLAVGKAIWLEAAHSSALRQSRGIISSAPTAKLPIPHG